MVKFFKMFYPVYLVALVVWWTIITKDSLQNTSTAYWFGFSYSLIALSGSFLGFFVIAKKWGGFKSTFGRAISFMSLGLFGLALGQLIWSYYNIIAHVEAPYPSIADLGYFSIVPFYALGMLFFAKVGGAKYTLRKGTNIAVAVIVPAAALAISYSFLLRGADLDNSSLLKSFFNFGQPLGEACVIAIAIITWQLSRKFLGGVMRNKILFILTALVIQYLTDFMFYYQFNQGTYQNGGNVDLFYAVSFTMMALALLRLEPKALQPVQEEGANDDGH